MPPSDSAALIVARFLKANRYEESYQAFIAEAGLPQHAGDVSKGDLTLETLLEEKRTFDVGMRFEKLGVEEDGIKGWSERAPLTPMPLSDLPGRANILSATVELYGEDRSPFLFTTSASRVLNILDVPQCTVRRSTSTLHDSPILSCTVLREKRLISSSMSGQVIASDVEGKILDTRRDHSKYVVKVAIFNDPDRQIVATAGWDNKICIYSPKNEGNFKFGEPISIALTSKPEAILFVQHPDSSEPILIVSRTDSNFLYFYTVEDEPRLLGQQNLAPTSNAWVSFTPSALALCPTDPSLLAVGTNSLPHMKLLIVRLLIPPYTKEATPSVPAPTLRRSLLDDTLVPETQASQARAALAIADKEAAAIQIHCSTMAPQTPYSTPAIAWRPDGSGVFVNGDDGAIRGIEAATGKIKTTLKAHEEGSKVRCLWAGMVRDEEWLVSGGFDQQLIVWKAEGGTG